MKELLFIYKAKSGYFNAAMDYVHKIVSPSTYPCDLCGITYGNLGMKREWKTYLANLPYKVTFLYEDTLPEDLHSYIPILPAVLLKDTEVDVILGKDDFTTIHTVGQLIDVLKAKGIPSP